MDISVGLFPFFFGFLAIHVSIYNVSLSPSFPCLRQLHPISVDLQGGGYPLVSPDYLKDPRPIPQ